MSQISKDTNWNKPLLLSHSYRYSLWGGDSLNGVYTEGSPSCDEPLAEIWLCSTYTGYESTIVSGYQKGRTLTAFIKEHPDILGSKYAETRDLPVLVKIIDAAKALSLQVHPDDDYAGTNEESDAGKTELWYVLEADKGASVFHGFLHDTNREELREWIEHGEIEQHIRKRYIEASDTILVDSGTIHAINAGAVILEVQEKSDITYRLWDYRRTDSSGNQRELHIDKALDVINYNQGRDIRTPIRQLKFVPGASEELLGRCRYFELHRVIVNAEERNAVNYQSTGESFEILICADAEALVKYEEEVLTVKKGNCLFVPANSCEISISGKATLLRVVC